MIKLDTRNIRMGDLLVELGLVTTKDLNEALEIGKDTGLPIGRVLTMSNFITEGQLQGTVIGQSLLKDNVIDFAALRRAMDLITSKKMVPEDAYSALGITNVSGTSTAKLGDLLAAAGFATPEQIEAAVTQSAVTGLPAGRLLVLSGILQERLLSSALNAQILIREGRVTRPQAIEGLRAVKARTSDPPNLGPTQKDFYALPNSRAVRLGELLTRAKIVSHEEVMASIEQGLLNGKQLGNMLVEHKRIREDILSYALELQSQIEAQEVTAEIAIEKLGTAHHEGIPKPLRRTPTDMVMPPQPPAREPVTLVKFLKTMRCVTEEQITKSLQMVLKDNEIFGSLMVKTGVVEAKTLERAKDIHQMLEAQTINMERASILFDLCQRKNLSAKEALEELSWQQGGHMTPPRPAASPAAPKPASKPADPKIIAGWEEARKPAEAAFQAKEWAHAAQLWLAALKIAEGLGELDPRYAYSMERFAETQLNLQKYDACEPLYTRAYELKAAILGPDNISVASTLNNLSKLYYFQGKFDKAEQLVQQFIAVCEKTLGPQHPDVACGIHNLATLYHNNKKYELAEKQYKKALEICRKTLGNEHPATVRLLKSYASLLKSLHRDAEAEHLDACAQSSITGSWKVISVDHQLILNDPE